MLGDDALIEQVADPDRLLQLPECEIIKDQLKIKVGCVPFVLAGRHSRIYVKRYNVFAWRYRVGSLVIESAALKALRGAGILTAAGVATARPIAAVEERQGRMLTRSFYLTEEVAASKIANRFWLEDLAPLTGVEGRRRRRAFLKFLGELFARLHQKNIYHNDLKDYNILVVPQGADRRPEFFLLDIEGVRGLSALSRRRRIKNLVQINRTLGRYLSRSQRMGFLKAYWAIAGSEGRERKAWAREVEQASQALDRQKAAI